MDENTVRQDDFPWRLPLYAAVGALILFAPIIVFGFDFGEFAYIVIAIPFISLTLIGISIFAKGRRLAVLSMLVAYWLVSIGLFIKSDELHWTARWFLESKQHKAELLKQPKSRNGELRHIEWEVDGFAGMESIIYLVFDPNDSLSAAASNGSFGKFRGIPCNTVARVRRLESEYYAVFFYTNNDWIHC